MSAGTAAPRAALARRWAPDGPALSPDLVLRLQRYRDPARAPRAVREAAEAVTAEAHRLVAPEAALWRGPVTAVDPEGAVTLDGVHRLHSRALARLLARSTEAYAVVLTVGPAVDERARALVEAQCFLEGLLLDTAAWAALVVLARDLRRRLLAEERAAGRAVTHRLAPGYLDWSVAEQAALLGVFGDTPLPVRVTESAWMLPAKSLSGVLGVVPG